MEIQKKYKAQILVIILIALAILSIFVLVIAATARRDTIERIQNEQYEVALSIAEGRLTQVINTPDVCSYSSGIYTCTDTSPNTSEKYETIVSVENSNQINNMLIEQDRNLKLNLNNYRGNIIFNWSSSSGSMAWIFSIDFQTSSGEYKTNKIMFNNDNFFTNPTNTPNCINSAPPNQQLTININDCGVDSNANILALRIKPLGANATVTISGANNFPEQVRLVTAKTYIKSDTNKTPPVAIVELQEPLYDSFVEIFDYVWRSESEIRFDD
jgi:hypothetical protein